MIGVATLLVVLLLALLITRVATVALRTTGLSHEAAQFQARSALSGVGYTTDEAEDIVNHPVRRRIVLGLMLLSSAGVVTTLASLLLSFAGSSGVRQSALRVVALLAGLLALWGIAASRWVDRNLSRLIEWGLARWTDLDARDYVRLLHIRDDYSIAEIHVDPGEWLEDRLVGDLLLAEEGVVVLGIHCADGRYLGAPARTARIRAGDVVVVYGWAPALERLEARRAGTAGDIAHREAVAEHRRQLEEEASAPRERVATTVPG